MSYLHICYHVKLIVFIAIKLIVTNITTFLTTKHIKRSFCFNLTVSKTVKIHFYSKTIRTRSVAITFYISNTEMHVTSAVHYWQTLDPTNINPRAHLISKLRSLRRFLKSWAKNYFVSITWKKQDILSSIETIAITLDT